MRIWIRKGIPPFSLRSKIMLGGILILMIPLAVIGAVTFLKSSRSLEELSKLQTVQLAGSLSDMVQLALEKDLRILTALAADPLVIDGANSGDYEITTQKLAELYRIIGSDYEGLAVYDNRGVLRADGVDQSRIGISISERNYFAAARQGKSGVGPLTASKATGRPIFGLSAPIMSEEGAFIGGVLGIVKADFLLRYISSLKLGNTGYAYMINSEGLIIAHPDEALILKMDSLKEPQLRDFAERMIRQNTGTGEYEYVGHRKVAGFATVQLTGWKIGVTQSKDEIMALAYSNRNFILLVSVVFIVLMVVAVFFLSRTISAPVQKTLATLSQAISQAAEAFVIIGPDRNVQFVNPAMAAIIDCPVPDLIGKPLAIAGIEPIDPEEIWAAVAEKRKWSGRITGGRSESSLFTLELTITPVRDNGGISCYLAIGRDITQELSMQERIRQSEKMEAIGTLAGGIAHDFNNILSAVFGYAELALDCPEDPAQSARHLTEILHAAKRAKDLVNHILAFSRRSNPDRKPVIPKYVVKEAIQLLRASLPATIEIREHPASAAAVLGDSTQIHQVVINLCTNAGYAMREQGGILTVSLDETDGDRDSDIQKSGLGPGPYLRLRISDTGSGISQEVQSRIFDPFFTTKPPGEGTGLGLSVVHGIVKSLNGSISVASEIGKGATFTVYLPIIRADAEAGEGEKEETLPRGSERVILVDDEPALIRSGTARLKGLGYEVAGFTDPVSAGEAFQADPNRFDVLVTDYTMPRMTGYDLAKKVREIRREMPIIICSGYFSLGEKIKELERVEFVKKPVTVRDIAHALRRVLDHRKDLSP